MLAAEKLSVKWQFNDISSRNTMAARQLSVPSSLACYPVPVGTEHVSLFAFKMGLNYIRSNGHTGPLGNIYLIVLSMAQMLKHTKLLG